MRNHAHRIEQFAIQKLHPDNAARRIHFEILLQHQQIIRQPDLRPVPQQTRQFLRRLQQVHARPTPALLRLHQRRLRRLAQFQRERPRSVQHPRPRQFQRAHQGQRQRHRPRVSPHIRARARLIEIQPRCRHAVRIERRALQIERTVRNSSPFQCGKQRFLPLRVLIQNNQVVIHGGCPLRLLHRAK